jgi:ketosteroid isomerase-like protein
MAAMKAVWFVCALLCFATIVPFSSPAFADDTDFKKQLEQMNSAYMESFNKQDVAGVAALYATGGIFVNPAGAQTDIAKLYEGTFKAGLNHAETTVDQIWTLGSDTALGMGRYRLTGKNQSGAPIEFAGLWTATFVREGGKWKVRMVSDIPQSPPPAK